MGQISFLMPNTALQQKVVKTLATAQVLNGIGVAGTVAAGSLLVSSITNSETLAGLAQTFSVLGAAAMALPLEITPRNICHSGVTGFVPFAAVKMNIGPAA